MLHYEHGARGGRRRRCGRKPGNAASAASQLWP
jgi:hypothetical protein